MFKINYKQIFWNLVWFFLLNNIDISFMLPYCYKSSNTIDDIQSKEIKQNVTIRTKITQDNELETISKNEDLNVDIDFYGNKDSLNLGDKNEKEEINTLFINCSFSCQLFCAVSVSGRLFSGAEFL